jgi:hypothetical protein
MDWYKKYRFKTDDEILPDGYVSDFPLTGIKLSTLNIVCNITEEEFFKGKNDRNNSIQLNYGEGWYIHNELVVLDIVSIRKRKLKYLK